MAKTNGNVSSVAFGFEKETKGAIRYQEHVEPGSLDEPIIGTLYIRKSGLKRLGFTQVPQRLTLSVGGA